MLKEMIEYETFDGTKVTEPFYFNLTKAEIAELSVSKGEDGQDISAYLQSIVNSNDNQKILRSFKWILGKAYGVRSEDGKHFIKKPEYAEEFFTSEAFSELFMHFMNDADYAAKFINAILPKDVVESMNANQNQPVLPQPPVQPTPAM